MLYCPLHSAIKKHDFMLLPELRGILSDDRLRKVNSAQAKLLLRCHSPVLNLLIQEKNTSGFIYVSSHNDLLALTNFVQSGCI